MTSLAPLLLVGLLVASGPDDARFGVNAQVTRDATDAYVRSLVMARVALPGATRDDLVAGFFVPFQSDLGVNPAELIEDRREKAGRRMVVTLRRVVEGVEVVGGVFRVTLAADGALEAYAAGDRMPLEARPAQVLDVEQARAAARASLSALVGQGAADQVWYQGKLAWRLRFAPDLSARRAGHAKAGITSAPMAPIVFVDAGSGEVLGFVNGLIR